MNRWKPQKCKAAYRKHKKLVTQGSLGGPKTKAMCGMGMFLLDKGETPILHRIEHVGNDARYGHTQLKEFFTYEYTEGYLDGFDGRNMADIFGDENKEYTQGYDDGLKGYKLSIELEV